MAGSIPIVCFCGNMDGTVQVFSFTTPELMNMPSASLGCGSCDVEASAVSVKPRLKLGQMHRALASLYRSLFVTNMGIILRGERSVLSLCVCSGTEATFVAKP